MAAILRKDNLLNLGLLMAVFYSALFALYYLSYPLALAPQLDAKENLILAESFSSHTIPSEPFYRAVLYPFLLSLIYPETIRPIAGLFLGLICHIASGFCVKILAEHIWRERSAGAIAGILYLINPVSLFYALQLMDFTLGITLFLAAVTIAIKSEKLRYLVISGILMGACVAVRPHFLPVAILLPFSIALIKKIELRKSLLIYPPLISILFIQGIINYQISGEFRVLPWQGAYNLYAANREGANGLYYKQIVDVSGSTYTNPTRAEAATLYQAETGEAPPFDISRMNQLWNKKTLEIVVSDWARLVELWAFKIYAVFNSYEQYNNLTYSYHERKLPLLNFNPLNWGILLILGSTGFIILLSKEKKYAAGILIFTLAYGSSLILYYASAKFRLPLVALLSTLGGGVVLFREYFRQKLIYAIGCTALFAGLLSFSSFGNIRNIDTYIQDDLLMANAYAEMGNDYQAANYAKAALREQPRRKEALRIYAVSYFNLQLTGNEDVPHFGSWNDQKKWVLQVPPEDPVQDAILGVYFWKWGEKERAEKIWSLISASENDGANLANACLIAAQKNINPSDNSKVDQLVMALRKILDANLDKENEGA